MPFPECVPELSDNVVRLRAHRLQDLARIVEQSRDPLTGAFTTVPRPYGEDDGRAFLEHIAEEWTTAGGRRHWAISRVDDPDSALLGTIDLRPDPAPGVAETGFGLHPEGRGQGLMAHALRLLARHWFDEGGQRVYWRAVRGNFASWRVAWACGFTHHATLPQALPHPDGSAPDGWVASLGREEPMAPQSPWLEPPLLEGGGGIRLRPWRDEDAAAVEEPDHPAHFMPEAGSLRPATFEQWLLRRRERMSLGQAVHWCIADASSDRALGDVVLFTRHGVLDGDHAELGYQLVPSAKGRGAGREAARLAVGHALAPLVDGGMGLRRIVAQTAADNEPSNALLAGAGFIQWGREHAVDPLPDGGYGDGLHWELLRPDEGPSGPASRP